MIKKSHAFYADKICTILLAIIFTILIVIHFDVNMSHFNAQMDADIAADTLLGPVLYENGFTTPSTWYGSTEVCVISAPNIAAFLYPITGYDMNVSMGLACNILIILFFTTMFIYYSQIHINLCESFAAAIIILSLSDVMSENQSILFLWAAYYASHFVTLYIISILYTVSLKKDKVPILFYPIGLALALANSLQGMHAALFCYVPLLGVEILRRFVNLIKTKKFGSNIMLTIWLFVITLTSVFGADFFGSYNLGASRNIRHAPEKFIEYVWPYLGRVINVKLAPILIWTICIIGILGYIILATDLLKNNSASNAVRSMPQESESETGDYLRWSALSHVASLVVCVLSTTFTTVEAAPRYYIMEIFIVAVGFALVMNRFRNSIGIYLSVLVMIVGIMASTYYYSALIKGDNSAGTDEYKVVEWMRDNGYEYGYATFDFANTITVMSNNDVKVRSINSFREMEGCKWLTDSVWYPPTKDTAGETCYIVTENTEGDFKTWMADNNPQVIKSQKLGRFMVYVLDHDYIVWVD